MLVLPAGCGVPRLIAADGTFLGIASSGLGADSVCNTVGLYGSKVSSTSIFNTVGTYGSPVSSQSAYSTITSTPPAIVCPVPNTIIAYVTKGSLKINRIDPDALCATLRASGL